MSNPEWAEPSPPGPPRQRPTVVSVSTWLLWLAAALYIISAVITLAYTGTFSDVFEEAYAGTEAAGTEGFAVAQFVIASVLSILFGVAFAVLGIFNNKGKNPSRITTWVVGGIAICCIGGSLALTAATSGMEIEGGPDPSEIERMLGDALPGWYDPVTMLATIGSVLAVIVSLILLALPPANAFFRKPPEDVFEPPPGYPPPPPPAGA